MDVTGDGNQDEDFSRLMLGRLPPKPLLTRLTVHIATIADLRTGLDASIAESHSSSDDGEEDDHSKDEDEDDCAARQEQPEDLGTHSSYSLSLEDIERIN
jgi:hypothetical protein